MTAPLSAAEQAPLILTVPGLDNSGPRHWQTLWERELDDCARVDLGSWDRPNRNAWVNTLNHAIHSAGRPVILVAHSLGCLAVAHWAAMERPDYGDPVVGALLVAPPEVDIAPVDARLNGFAPTPILPLPFPSIVAASRDDPYIQAHRARRLALLWGSQFADAGAVGHINAQSEIGRWDFGLFLLSRIAGRIRASRGEGLLQPFFVEPDGVGLGRGLPPVAD
ncbi:MAG: alpha/beta hydrolase [Sphingobium sp.]|nr:alpha/beta hydrolase [Sphingobium sp.]